MTAREVLAEIQARAKAATSGPWDVGVHAEGGPPWLVGETPTGRRAGRGVAEVHTSESAAFIAAARTDVPRLAAALTAALDVANRWEHLAVGEHLRSAITEALGGAE